MSLEFLVQLITLITLIAGFAFGAIQVVHFRRVRDREVALELVHSFQSPDFAEALFVVMSLPDGLSKRELEERLGERMRLVYLLWTTFESLGILVYRREVTLELVEDFFSGPAAIAWLKLEGYAADFRAEVGRETMGEWFQWLSERVRERERKTPPVPAHVEHRGWTPQRGTP